MEERVYEGLFGREPYQAFVPHGVNDWNPRVSESALDKVEDATERLLSLWQTREQTTALRWCLNRTEGIASSDVEGISTTLRSLSLLESLRGRRGSAGQKRDRQALGAVRLNVYALAVGGQRTERLDAAFIEEMHRRLFAGTDQHFAVGKFRDRQVWVGAAGAHTPARAHYVPPPHEFVGPLVEDLADCLSVRGWAPLVKASVAHLQFETIHPFIDGNGRIGRALMHCAIRRRLPGLAPVPVSAAIGARKQDYYDSLRDYQTYVGEPDADARSEAAEPAVAYTADAVMVACDYTEVVAEAVARMHQEWADLRLRSHSAAVAALAEMSTMPAVTVAYLTDRTGRTPRSVRAGMRKLVDSGAVAESVDEDSGRRVFELPAMLRAVDMRSEILDRCWMLRSSGAVPSVPDLVERLRNAPEARTGPSEHRSPAVHACGHTGVRSGARCVLRAGHAPPHRYTI